MADKEKPAEGWQEYKNPLQRKYHFIGPDTFSLCRGIGFYNGPLMRWTGKPKQVDDCSACYKLAARRFAKAGSE